MLANNKWKQTESIKKKKKNWFPDQNSTKQNTLWKEIKNLSLTFYMNKAFCLPNGDNTVSPRSWFTPESLFLLFRYWFRFHWGGLGGVTEYWK